MRSFVRLAAVGLLAVTPHLRAACPDFNLPRNYPAGAQPRIPVIADFNGDGKSDLAVTNFSSNDVSILIGNGDASFQPPVNYPTASNPNGIAVGDLNGDAKLDLVIGSYTSANASILLGNGDGTFQSAVNLAMNAEAPWLVLADFNNDSKLDLVVVQGISNELGILLGNGDGTFGAVTSIFASTSSNALTVADFNGDNKLDLATANYSAQSAGVLLGNGDGTFGIAMFYGVLSNATNVRSGDFNNDGKADLIVASVYGNQMLGVVSIFLGDGNGGFGQPPLQNGTGQPDVSQMAIGDFNSDGKKDVVIINSGASTFTAFLGQGDGTLVSIGLYPAGNIPYGVLTSDLDGDGKLDLVVANFYSTDVSVFAGNGNGTFATATSILYSGNFIAAADFNGDGKRDIALASSDPGFVTLSFLLGAGDGSFSLSDSDQFASAPPSAIVAADFNGDAKIDVVASTFAPSLAIGLGNGDGTFGAASIAPLASVLDDLHVTDLDGNGKNDLVAVNASSNSISVLLGNGDGTFVSPANYAPGSMPYGLVVDDFDGDGKPDVVVANPANYLLYLHGNGDGTLASAVNIPVGGATYAIAAADFNSDGKKDLVVIRDPSDPTILLGNGDGTFTSGDAYPSLNSSGLIHISDFDGDGKLDIAISNPSLNQILVLHGNGNGTFSLSPSYLFGLSPSQFVAEDFNGDNLPDLVSPHYVALNVRQPAPAITTAQSVPVGGGGSASVADHAGSTYAWTLIGGTITSGQGTSSIQFTAGTAGTRMTITVVETSVAGCASATATKHAMVDFLDVPPSHLFHDFIVKLANNGVTAGCGGGNYCPSDSVLRSQMAVFLLRGEHGEAYAPPSAVGVFSDVPVPSFFANFIERLYNEGITGGCATNPLRYCPGNPVLRSQMAIFLLRAEHGASYVPPTAVGIFQDVPVGSFAADFIERLFNEGITGGCSTNPPLYCPNAATTRGAMAVFLVRTFNLQ